MSKKEICIREYEINVDIIKDFWEIQKSCRESYYYLRSLMIRFESAGHIVIDGRSNDEVDRVRNRYKYLHEEGTKIKDSYLNKEKKIGIGDEALAEVAIELDTGKHMELKEFLDITRDSIYLKEKMNKIQLDIISFLSVEQEYSLERFIEKCNELKSLYLQHNNSLLNKVSFRHRSDEDRIDTYILDCNRSMLDSKDKKILKFPYKIKSVNHDFNLEKNRAIFEESQNEYLNIISNGTIVAEQRTLKAQNKILFCFAIISGIAAILSVIIGVADLYKNDSTPQKTDSIIPIYEIIPYRENKDISNSIGKE